MLNPGRRRPHSWIRHQALQLVRAVVVVLLAMVVVVVREGDRVVVLVVVLVRVLVSAMVPMRLRRTRHTTRANCRT